MKIRHSLGELSETQQLLYRCRIINRLSEGQIYLDRDTGKQFLLLARSDIAKKYQKVGVTVLHKHINKSCI